VTLFQEELENKFKLKRGFRIKNLILEKKKAYLEKLKSTDPKENCKKLIEYTLINLVKTTTNIPFFDIDFNNVLTLINNHKEYTDHLEEKKKIILFNQNLHIISAIYGYKFLDNKNLTAIDNQSFYQLHDIFPTTGKLLSEMSK
jgi:hypothetical protein